MQKSPEAIVADMLGLQEHMVGNVSLSTDTNSITLDENFDPKFVQGRIDRRIQFDVVSKDRSKIEPLADALEGQGLTGSLYITAITQRLRWSLWLLETSRRWAPVSRPGNIGIV